MPIPEKTGDAVTTDETGEDLDQETDKTTLVDGENVDGEGESTGDEESVTFQIGEEEITLEDYELMKTQQMLQTDYTKKTQQLAKDRQNIEQVVRNQDGGVLKAQIEVLEELIADLDTDVDVDDLSNKEFQALERKRTKRNKAIEDAKKTLGSSGQKTQSQLLDEQQKLVAAMPGWLGTDGNVAMDQVNKDMAVIQQAAGNFGYEMSSVDDHRMYAVLFAAGQYLNLKNKSDITGKQKPKTSKSSKPSNQKSGSAKTVEEIFYGTG